MKPVRNKKRRSSTVPHIPPAKREESIVLGHSLGDDFMCDDDLSLWPLRDINKHAVILGRPDEGKTTTAKKASFEFMAKEETGQVFTIDLGADPALARAVGSMAKKLNKKVRFYPQEKFNIWTADWKSTFHRLLEIIPFATEDTPAAHYTAKATVILELACRMKNDKGEEEPPRSIIELLDRLDYTMLKKKFGAKGVKGIKETEVEDVYTRCRELAAHFGTSLDGDWSFGDVDGAYFGLDSMVLGHGVAVTLRMLLAHLEYYIKHEKDPNRPCLVIIDEFAALSHKADVGMFVEQARKLGVGVIVMSQTVAGMGGSSQIQRILRSSGRLILHSTADWDELKGVLPIEEVAKITMAIGDGEDAEPDRMRHEEEYMVKQGDLLGLGKGQVIVVRKNEAALVEIEAPDDSGDDEFELPAQEAIYFPVEEVNKVKTEIDAPGFGKGDSPVESFQRSQIQIPDRFRKPDLHPESADSDADVDGATSGDTTGGADSPDE